MAHLCPDRASRPPIGLRHRQSSVFSSLAIVRPQNEQDRSKTIAEGQDEASHMHFGLDRNCLKRFVRVLCLLSAHQAIATGIAGMLCPCPIPDLNDRDILGLRASF